MRSSASKPPTVAHAHHRYMRRVHPTPLTDSPNPILVNDLGRVALSPFDGRLFCIPAVPRSRWTTARDENVESYVRRPTDERPVVSFHFRAANR